MRWYGVIGLVAFIGIWQQCSLARAAERHSIKPVPATAAAERQAPLRGCMGTYSAPPRGPDGHVDCRTLLDQLKDLGANTYAWLIWMAPASATRNAAFGGGIEEMAAARPARPFRLADVDLRSKSGLGDPASNVDRFILEVGRMQKRSA